MGNELMETGVMPEGTVKFQGTALAEVEKQRAIQEVQGAMLIAKKFPRDQNQVFTRIIESCKRPSLAAQAMYKYPKGGAIVTGPSIRLAEAIAQQYGNLDFGVVELERKQFSSVVQSYCWDLETNTKQSKIFEVPHEIGLKGGKKKVLTDGREIYEHIANQASRRMRACVLGIIPGDLVEAAVKQCQETIAKGNGEPLADRVRKMALAFKELGVSQEMIEERLSHKLDLVTTDEIVELTAIYTSLRDGQAKRGDFFNFPEEQERNQKAEAFSEKLKEKK